MDQMLQVAFMAGERSPRLPHKITQFCELLSFGLTFVACVCASDEAKVSICISAVEWDQLVTRQDE